MSAHSHFPWLAQDQPLYTTWQEQMREAAFTPELRQHLAARQHELLPRFATYYRKLYTLPRHMRRALQRQWKQSLAGMALLLTLGQAPALAATLTVSGPVQAQNVIVICSLVDAHHRGQQRYCHGRLSGR